ncbi:MAG: helix-turn-helix domain-containing protein [Pseudomonadota bacterium]
MSSSTKSSRRRSSRKSTSYRYDLRTLAEHEKAIIREALDRLDGSVSDCARALGLAKSTMYEKLYGYGLRRRKED